MDEIREMMKEDKEIWINLENGYSVSSWGKLMSHKKQLRDETTGRLSSWIIDNDIKTILNPSLNNSKGVFYYTTRINQKGVKVHRLICEAFWGKSDLVVDHIDGNTLNNCSWNLRWCTRQQNNLNSKLNSNNNSGVKGISYHNHSKKWVSGYVINGKNVCRYFKTKEEAILDRQNRVKEHYDQEFYVENRK
jgi:hypothetical protein